MGVLGGATWDGGTGLAAPSRESPVDLSVLHENLLSPRRMVEQLGGTGTLMNFLDQATRCLLDDGIITDREWGKLTDIGRMGFSYTTQTLKGIPLLILEQARALGGGSITMESIARAQATPAYQEGLQRILEMQKDGYPRISVQEMLDAFFAIADRHRDCREDLLRQNPDAHPNMLRDEYMAYNYTALLEYSLGVLISNVEQEQWEAIAKAGLALGILGGSGSAASHQEKVAALVEVATHQRLHAALAQHSPGYFTPRQLLEFSALVEEYNWGWAVASFPWGKKMGK